MHNRPLTVCNAKIRAEVDEKKKKEIRYLFPFDKAELLLVSFSFSGFSYRALSRTHSIGESSTLLNFIIWGHNWLKGYDQSDFDQSS